MDLRAWIQEIHDELTDIWSREPKILETQWVGEHMDREALKDLLRAGLRPPYILMIKDNKRLPSSRFVARRSMGNGEYVSLVDPSKVLTCLDNGHTVFLPRMDHWNANVDDMCRALSARFGRPVEAGLFATSAGSQGFNIHRDVGDVLVVQLNGAKQWSVYAGPDTDDWADGDLQDPGDALLEPEVMSGDTLYIPRGFGHAAVGSEGLSIHLTFLFREVETEDLTRALTASLVEGLELPARPRRHESLVATAAALRDQALERLAATDAEAIVAIARDRLRNAR